MKKERIERELRERLAPLVTEDSFDYVCATPDEIVAALLPWIAEVCEQVEAETQEECGHLP